MKDIVIPFEYPAIDGALLKMEDNSVYGPIDLPFVFPFFGKDYTKAWIAGNGCILFEAPENVNHLSNITLLPPDKGKAGIGPAVAALWERMQPGVCNTDMAYSVQKNSFGVEWREVPLGGAVYRRNSFQVWIKADGTVDIFYNHVFLRGLPTAAHPASSGIVGAIDHTRLRGFTARTIPTGSIDKMGIRFMPEEADFLDPETEPKAKLDAMTTTATTVVKGGAHKLVISRAALADVGQIVIDITE